MSKPFINLLILKMKEIMDHGKNYYVRRKGGCVLLNNGYQYYKNKTYKTGASVWTCIHKKSQKCRGTITLQDLRIVQNKPHDRCSPDFSKNELAYQMQKMRTAASESLKPMKSVYEEHITPFKDAGVDLITKIPSYSSVKTGLFACRKRAAGVSKLVFKTPAEVQIPPQFDDFKLAELRCDEKCIIAFCSEEAKRRISSYNIYYGDGTFHSCPSPFQQMYTIHGDAGSTSDCLNIVPLIYIFMTESTTESYVTVFNMIKQHLPGFNPSQIMTDYESAAMNAISEVFPLTVVKGCWYHYAKAIHRNAKKFGIIKKQHDKRIVALTTMLPFLPAELIREGWEYILDDLYDSDDDEMFQFQEYFEGQWLTPIQFKEKWSVYRELVRTNNCLEGWHSKINALVGKRKRPSILRLLSILKKDAEYYMIKMKGGLREKRKKTSLKRQEFVEKTYVMFEVTGMNVGFFLERLA